MQVVDEDEEIVVLEQDEMVDEVLVKTERLVDLLVLMDFEVVVVVEEIQLLVVQDLLVDQE